MFHADRYLDTSLDNLVDFLLFRIPAVAISKKDTKLNYKTIGYLLRPSNIKELEINGNFFGYL